jgi:hypothetical protein
VEETVEQPMGRTSILSLSTWREIDCGDCMCLSMSFKPALDGVELRSRLILSCDIDRLVSLVTDMNQRKRWDFRIKDAVLVGKAYQLLFDYTGRSEPCYVTCDLKRDETGVVFTISATATSVVKLYSVYTISELRKWDEASDYSEDSSDGTLSFPMSDSENCEGRHPSQCVLTHEMKADSIISRVFASDLIGESSLLQRSWLRLKDLAEGVRMEDEGNECSLSGAVERKNIAGKRLRTFRNCTPPARSEGRTLSISQRVFKPRRRSKH